MKRIFTGLRATLLIISVCLILNAQLTTPIHVTSKDEHLPQTKVLTTQNSTTKEILCSESIQENWHGTEAILEKLKGIQNRKESLTATTQSELKSLATRPTDPGGGIDDQQHILPQLYNTSHFVFHWTNGTDGGLPEDAPLPSGYLGSLGEIFEYVWNFTVNTRGFPAPPSDEAEPNDERNRNPDGRYDVFIYSFQYYGYAYPEQWPNSPSYSYIGVKNSMGSLGLRKVVAAHEFFHAVQFVYDCTEEMWWMETSAVYWEDEVYPSVNDNYQYLPSWFQMSDTYGLTNDTGLHEYGNFIWAKRLSEDFGDEVIKEIWQEMSYTDGLEAINNTLVSKNSSLTEAFSRFITANFFLEEMYVDGTDYRTVVTGKTTFDGVWIEYEYDASVEGNYTVINNNNVNYDLWMDRWAADYITLQLDPTKPVYNLTFVGFDTTTNYLVKLVTKKGNNITEQVFQLNGQKGTVILSYDDYDNVTLIMANAGDTPTTHPSWNVIITVLASEPVPLAILFVDPANITDVTLGPLEEFTVEVKIENVTNLYHIALTLSWNATLLNHTDHTVNIPVENYPGGVLHEPTTITQDTVNQNAGRYELNCSSLSPAEPFNGSGTVFNITFQVIERGESYLNIFSVSLVDVNNQTIFYRTSDGYFNNHFRDVALTEVRASTTCASPNSTINILVTVKNNGTFKQESFTVSVYWGEILIGSGTVIDLSPGTEETLKITWTIPADLEGCEKIWANATVIPEDINVDNNTFEDGTLTISIPSESPGMGYSGRRPLLK